MLPGPHCQGRIITSDHIFLLFIHLNFLVIHHIAGLVQSLAGGRHCTMVACTAGFMGAGLFRLTCYYYRGAYYKSFWADPPSCTVSEPRKNYRGENSFPLIIQNIHRYFLYIALFFLFFFLIDVWKALWFINPATGEKSFGIGVGTLVLAINVVLLGGYTLGCHSLRHMVGGFMDRLSGAPVRRKVYTVCQLF